MGAKLFKDSFSLQNLDKEKKSSLPIDEEQIEILCHKSINSEFNKLYLQSRGKLHAITQNPSDDMMKNMKQYLQQNSKFLKNCFSGMDLYLYDIIEEVTKRLTYESEDYIIKNIDDYLGAATTRGNYVYGK